MIAFVSVFTIIGYLAVAQNPIFYVSPRGRDENNSNCSYQLPCGSLSYATEIRVNNELFSEVDNIDIIVSGFNDNDTYFSKWGTCSQSLLATKSLNITFDVLINDQIDWGFCNLSGHGDAHITINNLVINNYTFGVQCMTFNKLTINNCTFKNMRSLSSLMSKDRSFAFITADTELEIYDSSFLNISTDFMGFSLIQIAETWYGSIIINNTVFNNLIVSDESSGNWITGNINNGSIENCEFNNIDISNSWSLLNFGSTGPRDVDEIIEYMISEQYINHVTFTSILYMNNVIFSNIISGSILNTNADVTVSMSNTDFQIPNINPINIKNPNFELINV
eukprot:439410_1